MDYDFAHATAQPPALVSQMPMVGGFKPVGPTTPEGRTAVATALQLVKTVSELEELALTNPQVVSIERQVVAGKIYRVAIRIGAADDRHVLSVKYFQNLKGGVQLQQVDFDGAPVMGGD